MGGHSSAPLGPWAGSVSIAKPTRLPSLLQPGRMLWKFWPLSPPGCLQPRSKGAGAQEPRPGLVQASAKGFRLLGLCFLSRVWAQGLLSVVLEALHVRHRREPAFRISQVEPTPNLELEFCSAWNKTHFGVFSNWVLLGARQAWAQVRRCGSCALGLLQSRACWVLGDPAPDASSFQGPCSQEWLRHCQPALPRWKPFLSFPI